MGTERVIKFVNLTIRFLKISSSEETLRADAYSLGFPPLWLTLSIPRTRKELQEPTIAFFSPPDLSLNLPRSYSRKKKLSSRSLLRSVQIPTYIWGQPLIDLTFTISFRDVLTCTWDEDIANFEIKPSVPLPRSQCL